MHDSLSAGHDRDVRFFHWFLFPPLQNIVSTKLAVLEISTDNQKVMAHVFAPQTATDNILFVVAFRGHIRWAEATDYCNHAEWENWTENVDHIVYNTMETAGAFAERRRFDSEVDDLISCNICGEDAKVDSSNLRCGSQNVLVADGPSCSSDVSSTTTSNVAAVEKSASLVQGWPLGPNLLDDIVPWMQPPSVGMIAWCQWMSCPQVVNRLH